MIYVAVTVMLFFLAYSSKNCRCYAILKLYTVYNMIVK